MAQQNQRRSSAGCVVAICGGILATLAFLVFPYISLGLFGSYTAVQLAGGIFGYSSPALWLELLVALTIIGSAAFAFSPKSDNTGVLVAIILLSSITILVLGIVYIQQSTQHDIFGGTGASYYSTGFWFYLVGIVAALVGGIVQLRNKGQAQYTIQQQQFHQQPNWPPQQPPQPPYEPSQP
jgi:hypothetical protein